MKAYCVSKQHLECCSISLENLDVVSGNKILLCLFIIDCSHLVDQITDERSHHKSNEQGNVNQRPSDPLLLQQFVRPALTTIWTGWRIVGAVVTTVGALYE